MCVMNRCPSARSTRISPEIRMKYHAASSNPPAGLRCLAIVVDLPPDIVWDARDVSSAPCPETRPPPSVNRMSGRPGQRRQDDPGHREHDRDEHGHGDPEDAALMIRRAGPEVE